MGAIGACLREKVEWVRRWDTVSSRADDKYVIKSLELVEGEHFCQIGVASVTSVAVNDELFQEEGKKTSNTITSDASPPGNSDANRRAQARAKLDMAAKLTETRD